jgi:DNA-binding response OmpR family regulator
MQRTVLLVSRDDELQLTRSILLQDAGYQVFRVDSVTGAVLLSGAERPNIALLCFTFTVDEQEAFIERVQETNSSLFVLCLRNGDVQPSDLLEACARSFRNQPGMTNVRILNGQPVEHISGDLGRVS